MSKDIGSGAIGERSKLAVKDHEYRRTFERLSFYKPSKKQMEMHNTTCKEALLRGANQSGKSECGGAEVAMQMLQRFPSWHKGWRQPKLSLNRQHTMVVWVLAPTSNMLLVGMATRLLGDIAGGRQGTGLIPKDSIISIQMQRGVAGLASSAVIRRDDGTTGIIRFISYEAGRMAMQSESVDMVLFDEFPRDQSLELWNEALARTTAVSGRLWLTGTPLLQASPIAYRFNHPEGRDSIIVPMTADDATHLTDAQRADMKRAYTSIELNTRYYGLEYAGGGSIFGTAISDIKENRDPSTFPWYRWPAGIGIDLAHGRSASSHPWAAVGGCFDPGQKVLHITHAVRLQGVLPETFVRAILNWEIGPGCRVFYPHDGSQTQLDGRTIAGILKSCGLNIYSEHSTFPNGGYGLEASISLVDGMLSRGALRVADHLKDWFDEYVSYSRDENNNVIAIRDDLMSATMCLARMTRKMRVLDQGAAGGRIIGPKLTRDHGAIPWGWVG